MKTKYKNLTIFIISFLTSGNWKPPKSLLLLFFIFLYFAFWQNFATRNNQLRIARKIKFRIKSSEKYFKVLVTTLIYKIRQKNSRPGST